MRMADYIKMARAIKENTTNEGSVIYAKSFLAALCDILAADNKKFDKVKFLEACK